jgi:hypothetical protein
MGLRMPTEHLSQREREGPSEAGRVRGYGFADDAHSSEAP